MSLSNFFNEYLDSFSSTDPVIKDSTLTYTKDDLSLYSILFEEVLSDFSSVSILLPRGAQYLSFYFCVLKSSLAAIPLNYSWSYSYIDYIINDCSPDLILTDLSGYNRFFADYPLVSQSIADDIYIVNLSCKSSSFNSKCGFDIAYVVYTSGSTGRPKGVSISNLAFSSYLRWSSFSFNIIPSGFHLLTGAINFDIILADFAIALSSLRPLWITKNSNNIFELSHLLLSDLISSAYFVPSGLQLCINFIETRSFTQSTKKLHLFSGGEYLSVALSKSLFCYFPNLLLYNMYGPTETTINCLSTQVLPEHLELDLIPTGFPFSHLSYFFDDITNPCTPNSSGELIISGNQLLSRYTSSSDNSKLFSLNDNLYYRTGDFFFTDSHLRFTFSHRVDNEVKIMGNRVNLDMLRDHCLQILDVSDILFIYNSGSLICFSIGLQSSHDYVTSTILSRFPSFCIPKQFISVSNFPVNSNGKIDRLKLLHDYE